MLITRRKIFILVLILTIFWGVDYYTQSVRSSLFSYLLNPFGTIFSRSAWWLKDKAYFWRNLARIKEENQRLFEENLLWQSRLARYAEMEKENTFLRKELNLAPRDRLNLLSALVIGREREDDFQGLVINRGERDGVILHLPVVVGEGVLVGQIVEVRPKTSVVELLTDNNSRVMAKIVESEAEGLVEGGQGRSLVLRMIPQTAAIKAGDTVVTSNASVYFPSGLLIGKIQEVYPSADKLFKEAVVLSPVDFSRLPLVWVVLPKEKGGENIQ